MIPILFFFFPNIGGAVAEVPGPAIPFPLTMPTHHVFVPGELSRNVFTPGDDRRHVKPGELPH